jgi:hypothetical protein
VLHQLSNAAARVRAVAWWHRPLEIWWHEHRGTLSWAYMFVVLAALVLMNPALTPFVALLAAPGPLGYDPVALADYMRQVSLDFLFRGIVPRDSADVVGEPPHGDRGRRGC